MRLASHWTDFFYEICYLSIIRKSFVERIQISLKSEKIDGQFACRPTHISDLVSLSSFYNEKFFQAEVAGKIETHFMFSNFFFSFENRAVYDNVTKYCRTGQATDGNTAHVHYLLDY